MPLLRACVPSVCECECECESDLGNWVPGTARWAPSDSRSMSWLAPRTPDPPPTLPLILWDVPAHCVGLLGAAGLLQTLDGQGPHLRSVLSQPSLAWNLAWPPSLLKTQKVTEQMGHGGVWGSASSPGVMGGCSPKSQGSVLEGQETVDRSGHRGLQCTPTLPQKAPHRMAYGVDTTRYRHPMYSGVQHDTQRRCAPSVF